MQKTTRRQFVKHVAATIGGLALTGPSTVFATSKPVKIAVYAPSHCALPAVHAFHNNLFKQNGVTVEIVYSSGMPDIMKKLVTGEVDFGQVMSPMIFQMHFGQMKFSQTPLAVTQVLGTNGGVLGISAKSKIKKIHDIEGKTIGVHSPLMVHNLILLLLLEKYGLNPNNIQIKTVPMNKIRHSLTSGEIDGFINPEPLPTLMEFSEISKSLLLTRMFWQNHPCCLLTCRQTVFEKNRQMVEDITRATTIACLMLDNIAMRKPQIEKLYTFNTPFKKLPLERLQQAFQPRRSDFYPFPFLSAGYVIVQQMKKANLIPFELNTKVSVNSIFKSDVAMKLIAQAAGEVPGTSVPASAERKESFKLI